LFRCFGRIGGAWDGVDWRLRRTRRGQVAVPGRASKTWSVWKTPESGRPSSRTAVPSCSTVHPRSDPDDEKGPRAGLHRVVGPFGGNRAGRRSVRAFEDIPPPVGRRSTTRTPRSPENRRAYPRQKKSRRRGAPGQPFSPPRSRRRLLLHAALPLCERVPWVVPVGRPVRSLDRPIDRLPVPFSRNTTAASSRVLPPLRKMRRGTTTLNVPEPEVLPEAVKTAARRAIPFPGPSALATEHYGRGVPRPGAWPTPETANSLVSLPVELKKGRRLVQVRGQGNSPSVWGRARPLPRRGPLLVGAS